MFLPRINNNQPKFPSNMSSHKSELFSTLLVAVLLIQSLVLNVVCASVPKESVFLSKVFKKDNKIGVNTSNIKAVEATLLFKRTFELELNVMDLENPHAVCAARLVDTTQENGWALLNITCLGGHHNALQAYGAGILEGYLTQENIYHFYQNQYGEWGFQKPNFPPKLLAFMQQNLEWIRRQAELQPFGYWEGVNNVLQQFNGLVHGYQQRVNETGKLDQKLSEIELYFLNAAGDLEDLIGVFSDEQDFADISKLKKRVKKVLFDNSEEDEPLTDCSALIKVLPNFADILIGHTTWRNFGIINKMYKWVTYNSGKHKEYSVSYASSPGFISSKDDFYIVNGNMGVMETTNSIFNRTLYNAVKPESVLTWIRSTLCNRLSNSGREWTECFARYNSGSYNNQWMVVDYKLFKPGTPLQPDTLWILEQIPGKTESSDVTDILNKQTFWSSYNIPYFKSIYNMSGYPERREQYGDDYSYEKCPRGLIFKREQDNIHSDLMQLGRVLQFNEWKTDPYSKGDPAKSISSRYDLREPPLNAVPFGGIDGKITSYQKAKTLGAFGICGPTHQSEDCPAFEWTDRWNGTSHEGQPNKFDFEWIDLSC